MNLSKIHGKRILSVSDIDDKYKEYKIDNTSAPYISKLTTFDINLQKNKTLLFLDPYGAYDTCFPIDTVDRIFGNGMYKRSFTVGIIKQTGKIVFITAKKSNDDCSLSIFNPLKFWSIKDMFIPKQYLDRLDELKTQKRPYGLHIRQAAMYSFITRSEGYNFLAENIVFSFRFDKNEFVEIWNDSYRVVSEWV